MGKKGRAMATDYLESSYSNTLTLKKLHECLHLEQRQKNCQFHLLILILTGTLSYQISTNLNQMVGWIQCKCFTTSMKKPGGIIALLDEACMFPKFTHDTFAQKLYQTLVKNKRFIKPKLSRTSFTISHYAGEVNYLADQFLEKNKGYVVAEHQGLLTVSKCPFVVGLFPPLPEESSKSSKISSIGSRFKDITMKGYVRKHEDYDMPANERFTKMSLMESKKPFSPNNIFDLVFCIYLIYKHVIFYTFHV